MAGGVCPQQAAGSCDPGSTLSSPQDRSGLVGTRVRDTEIPEGAIHPARGKVTPH